MIRTRTVHYLKNILFPAFVFGAITGIATGVFIALFRLLLSFVIKFSEKIYIVMRSHLWLVIPALFVIFFISVLIAKIHKKIPNAQGGGIPTSIGILRGLIPLRWFFNLIAVFFCSLFTFLIGVPLGNEGPSVQIGTDLGRGTIRLFSRKHLAWDRYVMTGGACAGFAAATNAPLSGILFAVEEAHQRISPMIVMVAFFAVSFSTTVLRALSPILSIHPDLFPFFTAGMKALPLTKLYLPAIVGLAVGIFSLFFLKTYIFLKNLCKKIHRHFHGAIRIFTVFAITLLFGLISFDFLSTGHALTEKLSDVKNVGFMLIAILIFRMIFTLLSNVSGITGGLFLPMISLGAIVSAGVGKFLITLGIMQESEYLLLLALGISACISGMMKSPLTAIVFSIEALGCSSNILPVIISTAISFLCTELFGGKSINESVIERRLEELHEGKKAVVYDTFLTVQKASFAIGKQIRDIFWPSNLFVLSITHNPIKGAVVDEHGDNTIQEEDVLHVRFSTFDEEETKKELLAIVGEQELGGKKVYKV